MSARITITALLVLTLTAAVALATDPEDRDEDSRLVVIGDDGDQLVVTMDGSELTITTEDEDGTTVRMVDMEQIGMMVGEALGSLDEILAGVADMQVDMHMGNDNRLNLNWDDETFELDIDEIMAQVNEALAEGLEEIRTEDWTDVRVRNRDEEELRDELRELKAELRDLRREIRDLNDDD